MELTIFLKISWKRPVNKDETWKLLDDQQGIDRLSVACKDAIAIFNIIVNNDWFIKWQIIIVLLTAQGTVVQIVFS